MENFIMLNGLMLGNRFIPYYGLMVCLGLLLSGFLGFILTRRFSMLFEDFLITYAYVAVFGFIGAKVLYLLVMAQYIEWSKITEPDYINVLMSGGFVYYGGLIGGILALPVVKKIHKIEVFDIVKAVIPCMPLAHAIGRIGCHLTGCCYGILYDGVFHIKYHNNPFAPNDIGLFPVQLADAACNLLFAGILLIYLLKKGPVIYTVYIYLTGYSIIRFILEFFRGDDNERGIFMHLSTSQIISLAILAFVVFLVKYSKIRETNKVDKCC